jgi:hypothetical protein
MIFLNFKCISLPSNNNLGKISFLNSQTNPRKELKMENYMVNHDKNFFSIVGYNAAKIFLIFELKYYHENKFISKMILTHESGAQEDQFDGEKIRPKISWYYPFKKHFDENFMTIVIAIKRIYFMDLRSSDILHED